MPSAGYDNLNVLQARGTKAKADRLAAALTKIRGVPVTRAVAIDIGITMALKQADRKLAVRAAAGKGAVR